MSGTKIGKRRTRAVIQPVSLPQLMPGDDKTDTRTERALQQLADAVNQMIEQLQRNVDLGNIE